MSDTRVSAEVVVVGAGPAGLAAACEAVAQGREVLVLEASPWLGGQVWRDTGCRVLPRQARYWLARLRSTGARVWTRTTVVAAPGPGTLLAETVDGATEIGWRRLVLATGARELFLPFPGWTLPGMMGPGAMQLLVKSGRAVAGRRVVVAGSGPLLLAVAALLRSAGARVICIVEQTPAARLARFGLALSRSAPGKWLEGAGYAGRLLGVPYRTGCWVAEARGHERVEAVDLTDGRRTWTVACDELACAYGFVPNVELPSLLGCRVEGQGVQVNEWQETTVPGVFAAGEPTGIGGVDRALWEGRIAGAAAGGQREPPMRWRTARRRAQQFSVALQDAFALRPELRRLAKPDTIVCRCEDVSYGALQTHDHWRAAKLHTRCGMGACQGRVCGAAVQELFGWQPLSVRPPVLPSRVGTLAASSGGPPSFVADQELNSV